MKHNKYWFKPKSFGYGATPTTWEGWAVIFVFIVYLLSLSMMLTQEGNMGKYFLYLVVGVVALIMISKKKTDGEWKWSWGKKEVKK